MSRLVILGGALWVGLCIGGSAAPMVTSYYHEPQRVACGGRFDPEAMTAAHRSYPCGTRLRVTYQGRSVDVVINDRGPYIPGRDLDLSLAAARALGITKQGVARVDVERL